MSVASEHRLEGGRTVESGLGSPPTDPTDGKRSGSRRTSRAIGIRLPSEAVELQPISMMEAECGSQSAHAFR